MKNKKKNFYTIFLSWIIGIGALVYLFSSVDWNSFLNVLTSANWEWFILACILNLWVIYVKAERWKILVSQFCKLNFKEAFYLTFMGFFGNLILPARGGDLIKGAYLHSKGVYLSTGISSVINDKFIDSIALFTSLIPFAFLFPSFLQKYLLGLNILCIFLFFLIYFLYRKFIKNSPSFKNQSFLTRFIAGFSMFDKKTIFFKTYILSLISWLFQMEILICCGRAIGLKITFLEVLCLLFGVNVALVIPSPPSGLGVIHASIVFVLSLFGIEESKALALAILYHGVSLLSLGSIAPFMLSLKEKFLSKESSRI